MIKLEDILGTNPILEKLYDKARFVDPFSKRVIIISDNKLVTEDFKCYDLWENNKVCANCVSMRACINNETYIKLEFNKSRVYLVTAIPYDLEGRRVIIELLKEVTDILILSGDDFNSAKIREVHNLIENMNQMASQDSLTGLYNRRYIDEKLPLDILHAALSDHSLALIMCDLDYFKDINDNYGHMKGDAALKEFSEILQKAVFSCKGWAARFGGDEFLLCIPDTDLEKAIEIGESISKAADGIRFESEVGEILLTVSLGIFIIKPDSNICAEEALRLTDEKMYIAKNKGRNRIEY